MTQKRLVYEEPSIVRAVDGWVELSGPDHVDVAMTADAAEETSERLLSESFKARGQRRLKSFPHRSSED